MIKIIINKFPIKIGVACILLFSTSLALAEESTARKWNEVLLDAIRVDYARPTVHARNLFHSAIVMYDAWAVYDKTAQTFF